MLGYPSGRPALLPPAAGHGGRRRGRGVARYSHWKGDRKPDFTSCSFFSPPIEPAVPVLHTIVKRAERAEDEYLDIKAILQARDEVLGRYQELSHPRKDLGSLTAEEFR